MQKTSQKQQYHPNKQLLTCRLCTDIFKKPITLTCGHSFCYHCLYKFMKQSHLSQEEEQKGECKGKEKGKQEEQQQLIMNNKNIVKQKQETTANHQFHNYFDLLQFTLHPNPSSATPHKTTTHPSTSTPPIPLPLCPQCSTLILKPIIHIKQNTTINNLISRSNYQPEIIFNNNHNVYDQELLNFAPSLLLKIQSPTIQPLPSAFSQIRFKTSFLDDIMQQSHSNFIVIQWPNFKKNIGLAGKIQNAISEYHSTSTRNNQNHYRAIFKGMFFVKILNKKTIEINLKSRYYAEATLYPDEQLQLADLTICKCEQFKSENIQHIRTFDQFFLFYDKLNNPHYLRQIKQLIDISPLFLRQNPEQMIYACMRILKIKPDDKRLMIESFDDEFRMHKIQEFLDKNQHLPVEEVIQIKIPGQYHSGIVFAIIILLILLSYMQNG